MNTKIKSLIKKQDELEQVFSGIKNKAISGAKLRKWIIDSVTHFIDVGVNPTIVDLFIKRCEFQKDAEGNDSHGIFEYRLLQRGYTLIYQGRTEDGSPSTIPVQVALNVSRMLVDKYAEDERIIPKHLLEIFNSIATKPIKISLESIESNYQSKDPGDMLSSLITATELICKLIPELKEVETISSSLKKLYDDKNLLKNYNINRDVIWSLNNARIVRNEEVTHIKSKHSGNIPMYEAVSYAHILVLFTDSLIVSGKININ